MDEATGKVIGETEGDEDGLSPSGRLWRTWFDRVGDNASMDVIEATAALVIGEREIYAAASRAEAEGLKLELETTDKLLEERNKILEDLPCPEHGPCVPYVRIWIRERKKGGTTKDEHQ